MDPGEKAVPATKPTFGQGSGAGLEVERDFASRSVIGERQEQEDYCAFCPDPTGTTASSLLMVLADGMGGTQAGAEASRIAVTSFIKEFNRADGSIRDRLLVAIHAANGAIEERVASDPERFEGMGTTLVGASASPAGIEWVSVGDSPLFHWSRGKKALRRINVDHSANASEEGGVGDSRRKKKRSSRLRSALVGGDIRLIDVSDNPLPFADGDILLAASDGILTMSVYKIGDKIEVNRNEPASRIAAALVTAVRAHRYEHQDNVTVAAIRLDAIRGAAPPTDRESP